MLAGGDEGVPCAIEHDARAVVLVGRRGRILHEDVLHFGHLRAVLGQPAARRGGGGAALPSAWRRSSRSSGPRRSPATTATSRRPPWPRAKTSGRPATGSESCAVGGDDAEPAGPLGDEVAAVRQEREAPGMLEAPARSSRRRARRPKTSPARGSAPAKAGWKAGTLGGPCSTGEADCAQAAVPPSNAAKARLAVVTGVMTGILLRQCVSRGKPLACCDVPSQRREGTRSLPAGGAARFCH